MPLSIKKTIFMDTRLKMMCVSINKAVFMDGPIDGRLSVACAVVNN